uniref:3CxxC-type domain-containing protein n=1 Tax=Taeniopygia guttata TaxID=59729 RepID=A0A674HIF5_TAEGU
MVNFPDWHHAVRSVLTLHGAPGMSWSPLCPDRFQCSQCFYSWSSAKVHILFHMCHCQGWGTVLMRIFRQKCRRCRNSQLEDPDFSLDTVETILHNLVIKILQYFYKKPVQPSDLLEVVVDTPVTGPHEHAHCEACELGICSRAQRAPALDAWKSLMDEDKARMHSIESGLAWPSEVRNWDGDNFLFCTCYCTVLWI